MPKLNTFDVVVKTGKSGRTTTPKWIINGFTVEFDQTSGGTGPGETFEATGNPGSFPHTLLLSGPEEGTWEIEEATVTYYPNGAQPYTVKLGAVSVDAESDLNIWYEQPQPVFDV